MEILSIISFIGVYTRHELYRLHDTIK